MYDARCKCIDSPKFNREKNQISIKKRENKNIKLLFGFIFNFPRIAQSSQNVHKRLEIEIAYHFDQQSTK